MDFILGSPPTLEKHAYIFVVVCCFSKMALFIPCNKNITTQQTTNLYFSHVWTTVSLPCSITSNRDGHFLSHF